MTEQTNFVEGGTPNLGSQSSAAPATSAPSVSTDTQSSSEQMLPQSKVNELIGREKTAAEARGYEKAKREAMANVNNNVQPEQNVQQVQSMGGIKQSSPDEIRRQVREEMNLQQQQAHNYQVANTFLQKLSLGAGKYNDFKDVVPDQFLESFVQQAPAVFHLTNSVDNTADVMYELAKNPEKIISLRDIAAMNPAAAQRKMQELAASIKVNEQALKQPNANEPLSQIKPSTVGTDNGSMTVSDYKKVDWLRG